MGSGEGGGMETLLWMTLVGLLIIGGLLMGFLTRSVWLGGALVLSGIAWAATILLAPRIFLILQPHYCYQLG